ncbi:hypothetical protein N7454_002768 [Penicillium verhagenii]|nr:hypothetical protein N7454_002768 [Penicillium verhagenii]
MTFEQRKTAVAFAYGIATTEVTERHVIDYLANIAHYAYEFNYLDVTGAMLMMETLSDDVIERLGKDTPMSMRSVFLELETIYSKDDFRSSFQLHQKWKNVQMGKNESCDAFLGRFKRTLRAYESGTCMKLPPDLVLHQFMDAIRDYEHHLQFLLSLEVEGSQEFMMDIVYGKFTSFCILQTGYSQTDSTPNQPPGEKPLTE